MRKHEKDQKVVQAVLTTPQGKKFLEVMMELFYHNDPYVKGDTHHTAFYLGQREVVAWLRDCLPEFQWKGDN